MSADLVVDDLTVEYRRGGYSVRPIEDFSCCVPDGTAALMLGPSGSGKTSLLSCLAGILRPWSGTIRHGATVLTDLRGVDVDRHRRFGVGIVFQSFNLIPSLSALDNVSLPFRTAGVRASEARRRATDLLTEVELSERRDHLPGQLSGGEQQRVAIARALALDPPLILADEPTAHLDYVQVETTLRILRRLVGPGRILVVVTHDHRLLPLADQVIELGTPGGETPGGTVDVMLDAGQLLFDQGDHADRIYVVEQGEIELLRRRTGGGTDPIARRGPHECFGEMGPLFHLPRSAAARARVPTRLTGYRVEDFADTLGIETLDGLVRQPGARTPHGFGLRTDPAPDSVDAGSLTGGDPGGFVRWPKTQRLLSPKQRK